MSRDSTTVTPGGDSTATATIAAAMSRPARAATSRARAQQLFAHPLERPRLGALARDQRRTHDREARPVHLPQRLLHLALHARIEERRRAARTERAHDREVPGPSLRQSRASLSGYSKSTRGSAPASPPCGSSCRARRTRGRRRSCARTSPSRSNSTTTWRSLSWRTLRAEVTPRQDDDALVAARREELAQAFATDQAGCAGEDRRRLLDAARFLTQLPRCAAIQRSTSPRSTSSGSAPSARISGVELAHVEARPEFLFGAVAQLAGS